MAIVYKVTLSVVYKTTVFGINKSTVLVMHKITLLVMRIKLTNAVTYFSKPIRPTTSALRAH